LYGKLANIEQKVFINEWLFGLDVYSQLP